MFKLRVAWFENIISMLSVLQLDSESVETHYTALSTTTSENPKYSPSNPKLSAGWGFTQGNFNLILKIWSTKFQLVSHCPQNSYNFCKYMNSVKSLPDFFLCISHCFATIVTHSKSEKWHLKNVKIIFLCLCF